MYVYSCLIRVVSIYKYTYIYNIYIIYIHIHIYINTHQNSKIIE